MSRHYAHMALSNRPPIVVNDNDVLSGRGVNIAHHPGNERFRTLVTTRADESYCTTYSASEKRAVAEEIIKHISTLDPPGRFLKRDGRGQVSRGLNGPWEELSEREAIKKTCQALRDCNRTDRAGYAIGVVPPQDVVKNAEERAQTGLTGKQHAAQAAAKAAAAAAAAASATLKRSADHFAMPPGVPGAPIVPPPPGGRVSPSVENAAEWLKKQRTDAGTDNLAAPVAAPGTLGGDGMLAPPPLPAHPGDPAAAAAAAAAAAQTTNGGPHHPAPYQLPPGYNPHDPAAAAAAQAAAAQAAAYPGMTADILQAQQAPPAAPGPAPEPAPSLDIQPEEVGPPGGPLNITEL